MDILPQLIINSLIAGSIYALLAVGFNLIFGATKFFNFAHGSSAAVGGYTVFFLLHTLGWPVLPAIIVGIFFAGLVGFILDKTVFLPLRKRKSSAMVILVASLGLFIAIQAVIAILFTSQFQTLGSNNESQAIYQIGSGVITRTQVIMFASSVLVLALLGCLLKFTLLGKAIKAVSDDEEVAKVVGINTNRIISHVFFIGSAIAGYAGILAGFDTGIEPTMGLSLLLKGVIAAIIGGVGNIYGAFLGAFLLGFIENFGIWKISGEWKDAVAFALLIVFLLFRPRGIISN